MHVEPAIGRQAVLRQFARLSFNFNVLLLKNNKRIFDMLISIAIVVSTAIVAHVAMCMTIA